MFHLKKVKLTKPVPFSKLIPNFLTLSSLVVGVSSVRFALESRWELVVYSTLIACILDGLDGRVARILNATSPFGAELDSLCDFANFGVAPAITIYLWSMNLGSSNVTLWASILLFVVCMAIRLARFNTSFLIKEESKLAKQFFTGVPAPCGALLALMPMIIDFDISSYFDINLKSIPFFMQIYMPIIGFLLASRLPTFAAKNIHIKPEYLSLSMILSAIVIINFIIYPWQALPIFALIYLLSIPICVIYSKRICRQIL